MMILLGLVGLAVLAYAIVHGLETRSALRRTRTREEIEPAVSPVAVGGRLGRLTPLLTAVFTVSIVAGIVLFMTGLNGIAGPFLVVGIYGSIALGVWFFLFSGKVRTAQPTARKRLWHGLFFAFFIPYALGLGAWLIAGLIPGVAGHSHALHERLHAFGGAPRVVQVVASDVQPFSIEGTQRIREITIRAGGRALIEFTSTPTDDGRVFEHNLAIFEGTQVLFTGDFVMPTLSTEGEGEGFEPTVRMYEFDAPPEGLYSYRCDRHPAVQKGTVRVLPASAPLTNPTEDQGIRDMVRKMAAVSHRAEDPLEIVADYLFSMVSFGLGIFLVLLRPRERTARVFGIAMIGTAAAYNLQSHAAIAAASSFDDPLHSILHPLTGITYIYALILFPDGHLVPRWSNRFVRWAYRGAIFFAAMNLLGLTGSFDPRFGQHPAALVVVFGMVIPAIGIVAQAYRLRRAPSSEARQQSRLLVWALSISAGLGVLILLIQGVNLRALIDPTQVDPTVIGAVESRAFRVFQPLFVVIPVALFVGIMRYRLWDVDLVISRALVYGTLAALIGAAYVGVVVGLGGAIGGQTGLSIAVTVLVALAFDPLRSRLQLLANRLIYGERASPYDVLADVARRLSNATTPDEALSAIAEGAGRGVGAVRARARLSLSDGGEGEAVWPAGDPEGSYDRVFEIVHQDRRIGEVAVAKRPGDPLRPAENRLLEALAGQVGLALQSLRLAEELRERVVQLEDAAAELAASRRRLVSAADAERRRLEQLIHDGVEHELVVMGEALATAERTFAHSRKKAVTVLESVSDQANETQEALRTLARGIFPPLLSDRGVQSALEGQVRKLAASVTVVGRLDERFDPRAEAAVYFCCIEALRRASRATADAAPVTVELGRENGWIRFAVRASGDETLGAGDLQLLVDRVEAVGGRLEVREADGRTELSGRVPAQASVDQTSVSRSGSNADLGT